MNEMEKAQEILDIYRFYKTVLKHSPLFSGELKMIPKKADQIQKELDVTVWNGNVHIANSKTSENSFSKSLLNEISHTGFQTKKVFEDSISNLNCQG